MNPYDLMSVSLIVRQMRKNSEKWYASAPAEQLRLAEENQSLAVELRTRYGVPVVYQPDGGTWHIGSVDGPLLYDLY